MCSRRKRNRTRSRRPRVSSVAASRRRLRDAHHACRPKYIGAWLPTAAVTLRPRVRPSALPKFEFFGGGWCPRKGPKSRRRQPPVPSSPTPPPPPEDDTRDGRRTRSVIDRDRAVSQEAHESTGARPSNLSGHVLRRHRRRRGRASLGDVQQRVSSWRQRRPPPRARDARTSPSTENAHPAAGLRIARLIWASTSSRWS